MDRSPRLLWLLVAYNNLGEVDEFVDALKSLPGAEYFGFAICDNSTNPSVSRHARSELVRIVSRPDNPGYLEGALVAYETFVDEFGSTPPWVALSNTDLSLVTGNPLAVLRGSKRPEGPVVVAPRITEGAPSIEKNPHLVARRSLRRLRINHWATAVSPFAAVYQSLGVLKRWLERARTGLRYDEVQWACKYPPGFEFYSPYGAMMFFSGEFMAAGVLPRHVPLLAEEYFIAEAAAELGAPIVYEPSIHVHHVAHVTTGPRVSLRRARGTATAFRAIYKHARNCAGA